MPPSIFAKPLLVAAAIAVLAGGFLGIYYVSAKYFFNESNQALSGLYQQPLESGLNELKLSTSLSSPGNDQSYRSLPGSPVIPAWLPILLFGCTLAGGWWLRWWYSHSDNRSVDKAPPHSAEMSSSVSGVASVQNNSDNPLDAEENFRTDSSQLMHKIARRDQQITKLNAQISSLRTEFDLLESHPGNDMPLTTPDELTLLKNESQSKSEIIHTLEELVSENREKWLVSDNTESVMRLEIAELTENLNAAMAIIRAHADSPGQSDDSEPGLDKPTNEPASNQ